MSGNTKASSKTHVGSYLEWFEDAYFLFSVRLFDASLARSNANPKKIYAIDHALVTSVASGVPVNAGHLLENLVFMALRRVTSRIYYYRTRRGKEVDFIALHSGNARMLVQVCETLDAAETRTREIEALEEAMAETGLAQATLVTRRETGRLEAGPGTIEMVPA